MNRRRFAETTKVPVERTRQEIEELLRRHGATQLLQASDTEVKKGETSAVVQFRISERMVRLRFGVPVKPQEARRKWRMMLMIMKAKLEFVADGGSTIEREFLADVLAARRASGGRVVSAAAQKLVRYRCDAPAVGRADGQTAQRAKLKTAA